MAGAVKVKNKHNQIIILDADKLDDFKRAISPLTISEFFRQQQEDIVDEYNKKKQTVAT